jgi:integrase/recombinase XerC
VLWVRELEAKFKPATVRVKLAAARALYAALRWSGATTADPFSDAKPGKDLTPAWEKREAYSLHEVQWLTKVADGHTLYL